MARSGVLATETAHEHKWEPVGVVSEDHISYSPVSEMDHTVQKIKYAVRSCECGALRKTIVGRGRVRWLNR